MEFELNGIEYRVSQLDARRQFHIMRRLSPMLAELAAAVNVQSDGLDALQPLANALAGMSDSDADYCLFGLLACVQKRQGKTWSKICVDNQLMFADMTMPVMLQIAVKAFQFNFSDFFKSPAQILKPSASKPENLSNG